jgi:hypothetical protein
MLSICGCHLTATGHSAALIAMWRQSRGGMIWNTARAWLFAFERWWVSAMTPAYSVTLLLAVLAVATSPWPSFAVFPAVLAVYAGLAAFGRWFDEVPAW